MTDGDADISFRFDDVFQCSAFPAGACLGSPGTASLNILAVPEPSSLLLLGSGLALIAQRRRAGVFLFSDSEFVQERGVRGA